MKAMQKSVRKYLSLGWVLCPVSDKSKAPNLHGWNRRENAVTRLDQAGLLTANVGLLHAYSGTVAIDVDDYLLAKPFLYQNGVDLDTLLTDSSSVLIDSGRLNRFKLLYKYPEPLQSLRLTTQGLELRCADANGGSVQDVLPPSIHPLGNAYQWGGYGDYSRLSMLPSELLNFWHGCRNIVPIATEQSIAEGSRNNTLTSLAGKLRNEGKDETAIAESLLIANNEQCNPPLSISEVQSIARSISRYEPGNAGDGIDDEGVIEEGDPLLPTGDYLVAYIRHRIHRNYHGYGPKIVVWFGITEGDYQGSIIRMFYNIAVDGKKWWALPGSRPSIEMLRLFPDARKNRISPAMLRGHVILARVGTNKRGTYSVVRKLLELKR
jgi:hypothetical protein